MKYVKILGLLAVAVAALMAFAASASADYATTTTGGESETPTFHAQTEGGHLSLANSIATINCISTFNGTVEGHGGGQSVTGNISSLSFTICTNSWTFEVNASGTFSLTSTSGHNGALRSSDVTMTAVRHTIFGTVECRYSTNNTHLGTIIGGNPATLQLEGSIPFHSGSGICGSGNSELTGNYVMTGPLYIADS